MRHLSAAKFGLRDGGHGAACGTFAAGDTLSDRHDMSVGCLECWQAYGLDRAVRLAIAESRLSPDMVPVEPHAQPAAVERAPSA